MRQHRSLPTNRATTAEATAEAATDLSLGNAHAQEQLRASNTEESTASAAGAFQLLGQSFGSLQALHDWLLAERDRPGSTVPHEPVLRVTVSPGATIHQREQTTWTYYSPDQQLILDGQGAVISGRHSGRPTPGWWLSYRPVVDSTQAAPAKANFEMRGLTIRGYESGGLEISPQSGAGAAHANDGGITAFLDGALIEANRFEQLGSKDTPYKKTNYDAGRFGAAGVLMRGVSGSTIADNVFEGLENGEVRGTPTGERLIHAVYARDRSCNNDIRDNTFQDVSGDPVRFSNASNDNQVSGNTARNAGLSTLVSEFYNSGPQRLEQDSTGNRVFNNDRGRAYGSRKKITKTQEKHVHTQ